MNLGYPEDNALKVRQMKNHTPMQELRQRAKKSREAVAVAVGVTSQTVYNWEAGRSEPTLTPAKTLELLTLYQCSLQELVEAIANTCHKEIAA